MSIRSLPRNEWSLLLLIATVRFALHLLLDGQYGFHRDELQVLDDARHLAWGYVPYPPLTPFFAAIDLTLFGDSPTGFRVFAALTQCVAMVLAGSIAREFGGGRAAQLLAALASMAMPFSLLAASQLEYVAPDLLWWVLLAWLLLRLINSGDSRWWLAIGGVIGLGMLTRYTIGACAVAIVVGVVVTPLRRELRSPWLWAGVVASLLVFVPNLLWQAQHDFVYLEFMRHIHERDIRWGRTSGYFPEQLFGNASVVTLPLWLGGLWFVLRARDDARQRIVACMYLVPLLLFALARGRGYYMAPAYPMLLAAGAVAFERILDRRSARVVTAMRATAWSLIALAIVTSAAVALPLAPVNSSGWRLSRAVHDNFAEQIGWPEFVEQVAGIYRALPDSERPLTGILASNYGEAGAIDFYGPALGLPAALSGVNTYWYRGYGDPPPQTLIVLGADPDDIAKAPATCALAGTVTNRFGVENEETRNNPQIFVCRDLRRPWPELWKRLRGFG